jgi:hypothetical protein
LFRNRLINEIPWNHLLSERIRAIIYVDYDLRNETGAGPLGQCIGGNDGMEASTLMLYKQPENWPVDFKRQRLRHTVYHEIAHSVYFRLRNSMRKRWDDLVDPNQPERYIVQTSPLSSPSEEFAICFAYYIQESNQVKLTDENKYMFLKNYVFNCREFVDLSS